MQALDAALAFAITMLVLAMVVTTIVETLHRIFGLREKGLEILLGNFYDRVLKSRIAGLATDPEQRRAFVEMMTINRGPVGRAPLAALQRTLNIDARSEDWKFLSWIWGGRRLGSLGLTPFMERLGSSPYGVQLAMQAGAVGDKGVEWILKDVAQKFDAFGVEASEYFESRARLLSVIVGFVLAFAINVNAISLFETFMKRPDVTQAVIARGNDVTARYEKLQTQADALQNTAALVPPPAAAGAPPGGASDAAVQKQLKESQAAVQKAADEAAEAVKGLQSVGVPIGWNVHSVAEFWRSLKTSLIGLLLGGLLIGLGGPFWYKAIQALTGVRSAARTTKDAVAQVTAAAPAAPAPNQVPTTPIDAFQAALGATLAAGEVRAFEEAVG